MGKYVEYVVPESGTMGDETMKAAPLPAAAVDSKARRRKYWVAGGVLLAVALAGVVLAITLPLTLGKDKKNSSSSSFTAAGGDSSASSGRDTPPIVPATSLNVTGTVREYFIAAEYHGWVYSPLDMNNCTGDAYAAEVIEALAPADAYRKAVFRQYTDASFEVGSCSPQGMRVGCTTCFQTRLLLFACPADTARHVRAVHSCVRGSGGLWIGPALTRCRPLQVRVPRPEDEEHLGYLGTAHAALRLDLWCTAPLHALPHAPCLPNE
jgi:hypothetical protein